MGVVAFDPAAFKARYPEFGAVLDATLAACFAEAGLYLANTDSSPVSNLTRRALLLNMLTAHIATLNGVAAPGTGPAPVGRVASGMQGAVQATFDYGSIGSEKWYAQTQYGVAFWQATLNLRRFQYIARPTVW